MSPGRHRSFSGVWGRTGQLAAVGVAVRHWVTYYGAYLNVCPPMGLFRLVETDGDGGGFAEEHSGRTDRCETSSVPLSRSDELPGGRASGTG